MILGRGLASALLSALLVGCMTRPVVTDPLMSNERISGRMSVQIDASDTEPAHGMSASFELTGDARRGRLDLSTPIGSMVARARWQPGAVFLETPQGSSEHASLADMTRAMLGEPLPVMAMFDWLRGRPWPGADSATSTPPEPAGFHQLGWVVDLSRFSQARIAARRSEPPAVVVQVRLDRE